MRSCRTHLQNILPLWRVLVLVMALIAPVAAYAAEGSWLDRVFSFETASANSVNTANSFTLRGVNLETSCLIRQEQFAPLFKPYMNKAIDDATILRLMKEMRSALSKQGFREVQTTYPASRVENGIVTLTVKAQVPEAMADVARTQCVNQPVIIAGKPGSAKFIKTVLLGGMVSVAP